MDVDRWDKDYGRLAALAGSVAGLRRFVKLYQELLTQTVAMQAHDVAGVATGTYRARLTMLQTLANEQRAWAAATFPQQHGNAARDVDAVRDQRNRRERTRAN